MVATRSKREQILDIAEAGVLTKGFGATSIDEIIAEAEITKSGFFYHFRDKNELARALLQRYLDSEEMILNQVFDRSRELHDDPLHGFLIGLKGFVGAIVGGLVSYPVAALGALLVGLLESYSSFWASAFKEVIVFTLIIPVLLWRSLTTKHVEEEE